jgi:6,7-dimethyl-8-ribityllumazine synthase
MNQTQNHTPSFLPRGRIAIVSASWHRDIVDQARLSLRAELEAQGIAPDSLEEFDVPGAFEIPLHAKVLAESGRFDAVIGCALVVDGGIYRHEFVASAVIDGLMRVQLDTGVPVFSAVLTPHHFHEHEVHRQFFADHFIEKGREVGRACAKTLQALQALARISSPSPRRAAPAQPAAMPG